MLQSIKNLHASIIACAMRIRRKMEDAVVE